MCLFRCAFRKNEKKKQFKFAEALRICTFAPGELAEWSIAAVLKTVDCNRSGGSNPSLSAEHARSL